MNSTESYNSARLITSDLLSELNKKITKHALRQARDATNWGFVDSLNELNTGLAKAVAFFDLPVK